MILVGPNYAAALSRKCAEAILKASLRTSLAISLTRFFSCARAYMRACAPVYYMWVCVGMHVFIVRLKCCACVCALRVRTACACITAFFSSSVSTGLGVSSRLACALARISQWSCGRADDD